MVTSRGLPFATSPTTSRTANAKIWKRQKKKKENNNEKFATFLARFETVFGFSVMRNNVETMSR